MCPVAGFVPNGVFAKSGFGEEMAIPKVAIVGRPNVGKSSLLNWLVGRRVSVVDARAGVTRDRVTALAKLDERLVELIDTGGIGLVDVDQLEDHVTRQIEIALHEADLILFVVDTRAGLTALDEEISRRLHTLQRPVICVPNKTDAPSLEPAAQEFSSLGWPIVPVSAEQRRGKSELITAMLDLLPQELSEDDKAAIEPEMKIAVVGRRNVGKSTFINTLAREERMIVSEIPGTTRDSVDVRFEMDGRVFVAIDTPGLRRRKSVRENVDFYGVCRAEASVRRADVVLLFFDATQDISGVDKQLAAYIAEQYKPCIFVVNKWDLMVGQIPTDVWVDRLAKAFGTMSYVPVAFITGKTGKNVKRLIELAQSLFKQSRQRVSTGRLNRVLQRLLKSNPPPLVGTKQVKIYYGTQVAVQPPTIVLVCNEPSLISSSYQRYLLNAMREELPYPEVPIRLLLRKRESRRVASKIPALDERDEEPSDDDVWAEDWFESTEET
ncbi:MAG: ribosome biogenesis GTPase Der [Thermogutta sp.]|nr:ribosome biogenesis GTPase Der [Thermogutta sp.]HPU05328.1 ribosome biogenesis GTPase Der [Thermogutta sp.]